MSDSHSLSMDAPLADPIRRPDKVASSVAVPADRPQHRLNTGLAIVLVALLALAAVPLGSNRPAFWAIWGMVLGLLGTVCGGLLLLMRAPPRVRISQLWPEVTLYLATCLHLLVQVLPLGRWVPQGVTLQDGTLLQFQGFSLDPGSTWLTLMQFASFGLLFNLVAQVAANRRRARRMMFALMLVIAAFALYGILALTQFGDTLLGFPKQAYRGFATGTFVNRNSFATFLASGLAIDAALLVDAVLDRQDRRTLSHRIVEIASILVCLAATGAALLATGSRMGTAAAAGGVLVAGLLAILTMRGSWRFGMGVLVALAAAALVMISVYGTGLVERIVFTPGIDQSRVEIHHQVWQAILQRPWLGYGGGSFASVFPLFQSPTLGANIWDHAHSTYLALWFEFGLVFGSLPLLIVVLLTARALRSITDRATAATAIAAIGVTTVFALHSLLDFSAEIEANAFLFTAVLALGATRLSGAAR